MNHPDEEVQRAANDPNAGGLSPKQLAIEAAKRLKQVLDGNDQRKACERVYGSYERSEELGPIDCRTAVEYLASLPQPDPGPIDAEWLESIGGVYQPQHDIYRIATRSGVNVDVRPGGWLWLSMECRGDIVEVAGCDSVDDVQRLIAALKGGAE